MKLDKPEVRELDERSVACATYVGNYIGNAQIFARLFDKLGRWAGTKGLIGPDTLLLSAYQDNPEVTPPDKLTLQCCMTVPDDAEVEEDIGKKKLPGGRYAVMRAELTGSEEYGQAWDALGNWMKENNVSIDMTRPSYEFYLNNPDEHPEKHHIVEICMSVL